MFNCFRFFNLTLEEIERMTLREYVIRMEAVRYRQVDEDLKIAKQSWFNQQAKAQKKKGKGTVSAFKNFKEFYDYEKALASLDDKPKELSAKHKRMAKIAEMYNQKQEEKQKKGG